MPNWCLTNYVVEGEKKDLDSLYEIMDRLGKMETPLVENGFGPNWLGCLLTELGEAIDDYQCRGAWYRLIRYGNTLRFLTETAYVPSTDVMDLLQSRFPSLRFYYRAEEPLCDILEIHDPTGKYFSEKPTDILICFDKGYDLFQEGNPESQEKCEEAYQCFKDAAMGGHAEAMAYLGVMYRNGFVVEKDNSKAAEWYQKAIDTGGVTLFSSIAYNNLGILYQRGEGVVKDLVKARDLFQKAVDKDGNERAKQHLDEVSQLL